MSWKLLSKWKCSPHSMESLHSKNGNTVWGIAKRVRCAPNQPTQTLAKRQPSEAQQSEAEGSAVGEGRGKQRTHRRSFPHCDCGMQRFMHCVGCAVRGWAFNPKDVHVIPSGFENFKFTVLFFFNFQFSIFAV